MSTMDIQAMQSMDWLFKKERIYLLAQFWQQRATLAEKEVSALKEQLAVANQPHSDTQKVTVPNSDDLTHRPSLEIEISAKDKEISQLVEDVHKLQTSIGQLQETTANQIARLEEELSHRRQHILRLETTLEIQRDYEDVKRQLSIFKAVDKRSENTDIVATTTATTTATTLASNTTEADRLAERVKSESDVAEKRNQSVSPIDLQSDLGRASSRSSEQSLLFPTNGPAVAAAAAAAAAAPGLQNVEQFGSFLGEEIVANWRRSLERTIISQSSSTSPPNVTAAALSLPSSKSFQLPPSPTNTSPVPHSPRETESHKTDYSHDAQESSEEIGQSKSNQTQSENSDKDGNDEAPISRNGTPKSLEADSPTPSLEHHHLHHHHHHHRGDGMTPCKSPASSSDPELMISNNNSPHLNNNNSSSNNNLPPGLINGLCGISMGLNNNLPVNFDMLKSQFRFEDPRSPFRFGDDPGSIVGRYGESLIPKGDPMEARLQEMLRYNMDKYATQNLDTLHIARRVRELLSIHNVGQRLFAKYVLGLSQGTVSELLSKPKPWDKLTEKGRDSYRKMHAWACDENAILLLKSLIPKKGKDPGIPNVFARGDNDMTDERIAHILNEASHLMKTSHNQDQETRSNEDSKSPNRGQCASPVSRDGLSNKKLKKYEHDDVSHDQVLRIYQEELAKLMGRRLEEHAFPGFMFPPLFGGNGGAGVGNNDDMRISLDAYHRELAKLQNCPQNQITQNMSGLLGLHVQSGNNNNSINNGQPPMSNGIIQDLSLPKSERKPESAKLPNGDLSNDRHDFKKDSIICPESISEAMKHVGSAFSLVRPKTEPGSMSACSSPLGNSILPPEDFSPSASVSPLQRMASITNSLISQPPTPHHHSPSQRPLKAVLPPITQQQFDQFNNLNTEEIVRKVKEQLSQFSISQRLFGESVLGLSQGSVSDLLARPKPWHMLTQKGREPFIRMKMFLEDDNAVHKLVASQYKIAPEKLMRTGGYGGPPPITPSSLAIGVGKPLPPTNCGKVMDPVKSENNSDRGIVPHHGFMHQIVPQVHPPPPSPVFSNSSSHHQLSPMEHFKKFNISASNHQPCNAMPQSHNLNALRNIGQHISPSVYEMAALTQELDTQTITTKIKEALLANNIGQKIFGEAVLGLSQGSVSELLSKPKPWHMLSIKGREPFIRMQLWLSDSHNIERLQALKSERRELNKRRRGSGQDNSSDTSSNDTSEFYNSSASSPPSAAKKQRVLFSEEQKEALRLAFALDPYPSVATIEFLASELGLVSRTITNWFHNHRMRLKQQSPHATDGQMNRESPNSNFDPVQFRVLLSQRLGFSALSLPFTNPYFPPNPELAALISRNILPTNEQLSGLDLSLKRDMSMNSDDEDDDMDNDSHMESDESGDEATIPEVTPSIIESRSSRRKPAAPQWVNPDWQEESEVIINGVCVMQTDDFASERQRDNETVHIEPKPAADGIDTRTEPVADTNGNTDEMDANKDSDRHNDSPHDKNKFLSKNNSNSEDSDEGESSSAEIKDSY